MKYTKKETWEWSNEDFTMKKITIDGREFFTLHQTSRGFRIFSEEDREVLMMALDVIKEALEHQTLKGS